MQEEAFDVLRRAPLERREFQEAELMPDLARRPPRYGLLSEYWYFLKTYKTWWLLPVLAAITVLGVLVVLGGTKAALLIYALF